MRHLRLWLLVCMGGCTLWMPSAQASWETYQQAGEAAYSRGDYATARRMFLAAVREARDLGPQDPRLDISLHKLALLRVTRNAHSKAGRHTPRRMTRKTAPARKHSLTHRGHRRRPAHPGLRHARPGRRHHTLRSGRHAEHRKGTRTTLTRRAYRGAHSHTRLHRPRSVHRTVPPARHGKRREALQTPRLQRGHTRQPSRTASRHPRTTVGRRNLTRSHR
jgi:hypothetical protein